MLQTGYSGKSGRTGYERCRRSDKISLNLAKTLKKRGICHFEIERFYLGFDFVLLTHELPEKLFVHEYMNFVVVHIPACFEERELFIRIILVG